MSPSLPHPLAQSPSRLWMPKIYYTYLIPQLLPTLPIPSLLCRSWQFRTVLPKLWVGHSLVQWTSSLMMLTIWGLSLPPGAISRVDKPPISPSTIRHCLVQLNTSWGLWCRLARTGSQRQAGASLALLMRPAISYSRIQPIWECPFGPTPPSHWPEWPTFILTQIS